MISGPQKKVGAGIDSLSTKPAGTQIMRNERIKPCEGIQGVYLVTAALAHIIFEELDDWANLETNSGELRNNSFERRNPF